MTTELGEIPSDLHRSQVKVSESDLHDWLLIQQDDAVVCVSRRQAEQLARYLEDFIEQKGAVKWIWLTSGSAAP